VDELIDVEKLGKQKSDGCARVIVDYINPGITLHLLFNKNYQQVNVLFHAHNRYLELLLVGLLARVGVCVEFHEFHSKHSFRAHTELADSLAAEFVSELNIDDVGGMYFFTRLGRVFYTQVYRLASILQFVRTNPQLEDAGPLYLNGSRLWRRLVKGKQLGEIKFYKSFWNMADQECQATYRPNLIFSVRSFLRGVALFLNDTFMVVPYRWPKALKLDAVLHMHPDVLERRLFGQQEVMHAVGSYGLLENALRLQVGRNRYHVRRVPLNRALAYLRHWFKGWGLFVAARPLGATAVLILIGEWMRSFHLNQMVESLQPAVFYSNYESNNALLMQSMLKQSDCISAASTYSAGYFPVRFGFSHQVKSADIFFVWGGYLSELYIASGDSSQRHVITGYVGDCFKRDFIAEGNNLRKGDKTSIVAIYDSTYANDLFLSRKETVVFVELVTRHVVDMGARVIIKTKRGLDLYDDLCQEFPQQIGLIYEHASLSAAAAADVVVGYLSSTPVLIAGAWGKKIVLFDPDRFVWESGSASFLDCLVTTETELKQRLSRVLSCSGAKIRGRELHDIDPFADGRAVERISGLLKKIVESKKEDKDKVLAHALQWFADEWGEAYILENSLSDMK